MDFRILGPLEVRDGIASCRLRGRLAARAPGATDVIGNPDGPDLDRYMRRRFDGLI